MTNEELAEIDGHRFCSCDCDGNVCREYAEKLITEVRRLKKDLEMAMAVINAVEGCRCADLCGDCCQILKWEQTP